MSANSPPPTFSHTSEVRRLRIKTRLNVVLSVVFAFAILIVTNYSASILYAHWTFDVDARVGLSSRTLEFLQRSQGEIRVTALFERSHPFRNAARRLLKEYAEAAELIPGLDIAIQTLDVNHDISASTEIMRRLPVDVNAIIIEYGSQSQIISEYDLLFSESASTWADDTSQANKRHRFNGESVCTSALINLLQPIPAIVYFTQGHGEYSLEDAHQITGASTAGHALSLAGLSVRLLDLPRQESIPQDCDVLLIAGPRTTYSQREIELISSYLDRGGKAMLLIDDADASGLTPLLEKWGLRTETRRKGMDALTHIPASIYSSHPITRRLGNTTTFFSNPCIVDAISTTFSSAEQADKPRTTRLIMADDVPIVVASEIGGATLTGRRNNTRLIVAGDSDFISNAMSRHGFDGNRILLLASIEWLIGQQMRPISLDDSLPILQAGVSPDGGWLRLATALALAFPAIILLSGLFIFLPFFRKA